MGIEQNADYFVPDVQFKIAAAARGPGSNILKESL
jgi:hypothetical protein